MAPTVDPPAVRSTDLRNKREITRVFLSMASPRIIVVAVSVTVILRITLWDWSLGDVIVVVGVLLFTGPAEWVIHRFVLHCDPASLRAKKLGAGESHRKHHLDPPDIEHLVLSGADSVGFIVILAAFTAGWAVPLLVLTRSEVLLPALTALVVTYLGFANYEWTHLMVHTLYRPRTRLYRRLARNHRRHHYRNENYWMGVTSNLGDRLMRTLPRSKTDVPLSVTAKTLREEEPTT